jgi:hypothetical protein
MQQQRVQLNHHHPKFKHWSPAAISFFYTS